MGLRTNFVLIDYENVQPKMLGGLEAEHFRLIVFVGANQSKIAFETAAALQGFGSKASYVQISGNGSNALDFHIALYIGQLSAQDPTAFFHIISKDKGFDPLIAHLKTRKIFAARSRDVSDIQLLKIANSKFPKEKIAAIVNYLQYRGTSKPRTVATLTNTISLLFQKQLAEEELQSLLKSMEVDGLVVVKGVKVTYNLLG